MFKPQSTPLKDCFWIEREYFSDHRGTFLRLFDADFFREKELPAEYPHVNFVKNQSRGVIRGLHFQRTPWAEAKFVTCLTGSILDVVVDVRPMSPTFGKSFSKRLTEESGMSLYVPPGFAHGYETLEDNTSILYFSSARYKPAFESGIHYLSLDCSAFWRSRNSQDAPLISEKDHVLPVIHGLDDLRRLVV